MVINKSGMQLSYPPGLKPGDSIGIIAAGGKVEASAVEKGCRVIIENGFVPVVSGTLFRQNGYFAGSDRDRAESLMEMFLNPEIKAIVCARGGYGCIRMAEFLDYDLIAANPKIFMGFSDNTLLLSEITSRGEFITWHGPMVSSIAYSDKESADSFFSVLSGTWKRRWILHDMVSLSGGTRLEGEAICGNLTTFCHTAGTKYQKNWSGCLLFIEDINEPAYKIDRMIFHMRLAGMFDGLKAVILGCFDGSAPLSEIHDLFVREFSSTETAVIAWPGFGHGTRNIPVPFGANVLIDLNQGVVEWI
ncbi:S66 peptidase family protein [Desulforegula conservatrix]|uniref:S66 peptidase family protein n=1 Tax=Desulforegula conservatrix TaxID=153026 RepID=UPI00041D0894|nr:LD-carboxypeptidase [Desulforegula conservatrix]